VPVIHINKVVWFSPSIGVYTERNVLGYSPQDIHEMLHVAYSHIQDHLLVDACCGECEPFADYAQLSLEEYLKLKERFEKEIAVKEATKGAKREYTKLRRNSFNQQRARLILKMIEDGIPYICTVEGCEISKELTVDHVIPLSKGGSDKVENLQFMCLSHNSSKGDMTVFD